MKKNLLIILLVCIIVASAGFIFFLFSTKYTPVNSNTAISAEEAVKIPEENISQKEIDELSGCIAAFTPIDETFSKSKKITKEAKNALEYYRKGWQDLCAGKSERSLHPLWMEAKKLTQLKSDYEYYYSGLCDGGEDGECLPISYFTPGIDELTGEGMILDFAPSQKLFAENVLLGSQEDKDFFTTYSLLGLDNSNNFSPWVEQTWDYGGCVNYGTYDWVGTLKKLDELSVKIISPQYLEIVSSTRSDITNYDPSNTYQRKICTCGNKEAVMSDLEKILGHVKKDVFYKEKVPKISNFIEEIKSGRIEVFSQAERHCSGG